MPAHPVASNPVNETSLFTSHRPLFLSPAPAGRQITAGFTFLQRIGKSASIDVWFPQILREQLDTLVARGVKLLPKHFPAEWAAVRQFELLQESGNYKIYDMDATHLTRTLMDSARNMRGGGYRITVATLGSYVSEKLKDDLEILDQRLQKRILGLIHMLYLDEQSESINKANDQLLNGGVWDFQKTLPHVGMVLGSRKLFKPITRDGKLKASDMKHMQAEQFFEILNLLPQDHIVHDTAVGLQLPESINEHEWIYLAAGDKTKQAIESMLTDIFSKFDGINMGALDGRVDAPSEIKSVTQHMRGYGERLTAEAQKTYGCFAKLAMH